MFPLYYIVVLIVQEQQIPVNVATMMHCDSLVMRINNYKKQVEQFAEKTISCNGRIATKGAKTIYLAFENERMRYTNYLWIEVEAVVPNKVYYRTKYKVN